MQQGMLKNSKSHMLKSSMDGSSGRTYSESLGYKKENTSAAPRTNGEALSAGYGDILSEDEFNSAKRNIGSLNYSEYGKYKNYNAYLSGEYKGTGNGNDTENTFATSSSPLSYSEYIEVLKSEAEKQKEASLRTAENDRKRRIVDSAANYERSLSTYGSRAEALSKMGLTGSGYSQYLDSEAYAQYRADVQAINSDYDKKKSEAEAAYSKKLFSADEMLMAYNENRDAEKKNALASLLQHANAGTYDSAQLAELAGKYGLGDEEKGLLESAAYSRKQKELRENYKSYYQGIYNGTVTDSKVIDSAVSGGEISSEDGESLKGYLKSLEYKASDIGSGALESSSSGSGTDKKEQYAEKYPIAYKTENIIPDGRGYDSASLSKEGSDITIGMYEGDKLTHYKVSAGGKCESNDDAVKAAFGAGLGNNDVFVYNRSLYLVYDGDVYRITGKKGKEDNTWIKSLKANVTGTLPEAW